MTLNVTIVDRPQRDRFKLELQRMRAQVAELAATGPAPRQLPQHHRAILRSARANAREIAHAIAAFDRTEAEARRRGKRRRGNGRVAQGESGG